MKFREKRKQSSQNNGHVHVPVRENIYLRKRAVSKSQSTTKNAHETNPITCVL